MFILFRNSGLIDLAAVSTFGASSKEGDNPIGYFGTGLKYAVAILLRSGATVRLHRGNRRFNFFSQPTRIRNDEFDVVYWQERGKKAQSLGFTTRLGINWELWQAFRELYCNMLDEQGHAEKAADWSVGENETLFAVKHPEFEKLYADRHNIVLADTPHLKGENADAYLGSSKHLFYRGVRVATAERPTLYRYNITRSIDLTEDRTIKYAFQVRYALLKMIINSSDPEFVASVLTAPEDYYESKLDYTEAAYNLPSDLFISTVRKLKGHARLNSTAVKYLASYLPKEEPSLAQLTDVQREDLKDGAALAVRVVPELHQYPIIPTEDLPDGTMGQVIIGVNKIFIAVRTLSMGRRMIAGTLMEEFLHLKHGLDDCSRPMQNWLIDRLMQEIEGHE